MFNAHFPLDFVMMTLFSMAFKRKTEWSNKNWRTLFANTVDDTKIIDINAKIRICDIRIVLIAKKKTRRNDRLPSILLNHNVFVYVLILFVWLLLFFSTWAPSLHGIIKWDIFTTC